MEKGDFFVGQAIVRCLSTSLRPVLPNKQDTEEVIIVHISMQLQNIFLPVLLVLCNKQDTEEVLYTLVGNGKKSFCVQLVLQDREVVFYFFYITL